MPYCENCGKPVNPDAKFCSSCGTPTNNPAITQQEPETQQSYPSAPFPPPPPPEDSMPQIPLTPSAPQVAQASSEPVFGAIVLKRPKSLGRWDTYTGVVTNQRLIFAQMTNEMLKVAAQQARDQAKAEGKGFFGQWKDQLRATFGYAQRYLSMSPQAILSETPGNFFLDNNIISEIKLKERHVQEDQQIYEFEIQFHSTAGNYEYHMDQNSDYVKLLKQVYGERVKTPFGYFNKTINIKF